MNATPSCSPAAKGQKPVKILHNIYDRETLEKKISTEDFERVTISFYRYVNISEPELTRSKLYAEWAGLNCLGRIYVANEGINAQMSIPEHNYQSFLDNLEGHFPNMPIKVAVEEAKPSFIKLNVKVKKKILADGQEDNSYDVSNVGRHLTAKEFNDAMDQDGTIVVDIRNAYESEVGHFENALRPDVDSFSEELPVVREMLEGQEDKKILLYCTGGIRCEKTSAWLKHQGYQDVNQLHGGIIDYVRQVKDENLECKYIGKNFVFDERLGERVSDDVIANCHVCGDVSDDQYNCSWQGCHTLFVCCPSCYSIQEGCCTSECQETLKLPDEEKKELLRNPKAPLAAKRNLNRVPPKK